MSTDRARGFVLLSVIVMLALLASLVLMTLNVTDTQMGISADLSSAARLQYAAESGLEHAAWTLRQHAECTGYPDVAPVTLGDARFSARVSPNAGSPVTLEVRATLGSVAAREVSRETVVYDRSQLKVLVLNNPAQIKDVYLEGESGHTDHNKETDRKISISAEPNKLDHGLIEFDLSELPLSVRIESAELRLEQNKSGSQETVFVHRVTRSWVEGDVTWEEAEAGVGWSSPGGDYYSEPAASFEADGEGVKTVDVTRVVASWADGTYDNYGLLLRSEETAGGAANEFISSDDGGEGFPVLTLVYACECGQPCSGSNVDRGALAHWRFDDGTGVVATDSAGNHNGAVTHGPVWSADGARDGSLEFDGVNDHVLVAHHDELLFSDALTVTAWVNVRSPLPSFSHDVISKETSGSGDNFWLNVDDLGVVFGVGGDLFTADSPIVANRWYHVAATYSAELGEVRLYIDGVLLSTVSTNVELIPNDAPLYLGSNWANAQPWLGYLDDVQLFDWVLGDEEILDVMNAVETGSSSPVYATYRDRFDARSFAGSDGTQNWSTDWLEVGESNGGTAGDIQVRFDDLNTYALRVRDNDNGGEGVQREFDLLACARAQLAFDYRRDGLDSASDYVSVAVSDNGGSSWVELTRLTGPDDDTEYAHYTADISGYRAANTRVRLLSSPSLGNTDEVWFDNVSVLCD